MSCVAAKKKWRKNKIILKPYFYSGFFCLFLGTCKIYIRPEGILLSKVSRCFLLCILDNRTYHFQAEDEQDYVA